MSPSGMDVLFLFTDVTRYLSGAGLVALVYDHILTLPSEISLIWPAPSSYAKHLFLVNRYLVPGSLIAISYEMNHFGGDPLTQNTCRNLLSTVAMLSIVSLGIANILVLLRVVSLWDRSHSVVWLLTIGFIISFGASSSMMLASLVELADSIAYSPLFSMCILSKTTPKLIVVWGAPMVFETIVLTATCWNALSVPRQANMPLKAALHRDGVTFFIALFLFRGINLSLAATRRPELVMMTVFFVWSMTTLVLNRSLLRLQRAENLQLVLNDMIEEELAEPQPPRNTWLNDGNFADNLAGMGSKSLNDEEMLSDRRNR